MPLNVVCPWDLVGTMAGDPDLWGFCGAATRLSVDAETVDGLGECEEPAGAESAGVAGQVVAAAQLRHDPAGERLVFAGAVPGGTAWVPRPNRIWCGNHGWGLDFSALAEAWRIPPTPLIWARFHGTTPSISVSSEKLRTVLIRTISRERGHC